MSDPVYISSDRPVTINAYNWPKGSAAYRLGFELGVGLLAGVCTVVSVSTLIAKLVSWAVS